MNQSKIIWTENALQELERLLGTRNLDVEELEEGLGGLDFPWPIVIKSITADRDPSGETWSNLVIEFDEIAGAGGYEVKFSLVPDIGQFEIVNPQEIVYASSEDGSRSGDIYEGSIAHPWKIAIPSVTNSDIGIVVINGSPVWSDPVVWDPQPGPEPGRGFATWELIYDSADTAGMSIWLGRGAGTGDVRWWNWGPLVAYGSAGGVIAKNWSAADVIDYSVSVEYPTVPATLSTPSLSASSNELIITAVKGGGVSVGGSNERYSIDPDPGSQTDYGFSGQFVPVNIFSGIYRNGFGISAGYVDNPATVYSDYSTYDGSGAGRRCYLTTIRVGF